MRKDSILIILSFIILSGCKSCFNDLYRTHEKPVALSIVFEMPEEQIVRLEKFIDSSNNFVKDKISTFPINSIQVGSKQKKSV